MGQNKRTYSPELKAKMIFEGVVFPDGIAAYCRKNGIKDTLFYKWKKQIISSADLIFKPKQKITAKETRLEGEIAKKDGIISQLVEENLSLKKKNGILQ